MDVATSMVPVELGGGVGLLPGVMKYQAVAQGPVSLSLDARTRQKYVDASRNLPDGIE